MRFTEEQLALHHAVGRLGENAITSVAAGIDESDPSSGESHAMVNGRVRVRGSDAA